MNSNEEILIMGSLNARVANRDDFINDNHVVLSLRDYEDYPLDEVNVTRKSCDKNINRFGLDLIQFCKTYMFQICNGRIGEDKGIGNFTVTGTNGNSVLDYALCSTNLTYLVEKIKIEERTESSRFPVSVGLKCQLSTSAMDTNITGKTTQCKYFFNDNTTTEYRDNLTSLFTNEFVHSFALETDNDTNSIDHITEKFTNVLKECCQGCQHTIVLPE